MYTKQDYIKDIDMAYQYQQEKVTVLEQQANSNSVSMMLTDAIRNRSILGFIKSAIDGNEPSIVDKQIVQRWLVSMRGTNSGNVKYVLKHAPIDGEDLLDYMKRNPNDNLNTVMKRLYYYNCEVVNNKIVSKVKLLPEVEK